MREIKKSTQLRLLELGITIHFTSGSWHIDPVIVLLEEMGLDDMIIHTATMPTCPDAASWSTGHSLQHNRDNHIYTVVMVVMSMQNSFIRR